VTYKKFTGYYEFLIEAKEGSPHYVAVALSHDGELGGDSVVECSRENGGFHTIRTSWNSDEGNTRDETLPDWITDYSASNIDGEVTCMFKRKVTSKHGPDEVDFNLNANIFVISAQGPERDDGEPGIGEPEEWYTTQAAISLGTTDNSYP
jgi:hypothetical protein